MGQVYAPEVAAVVTFELASQALRDTAQRTHERVESVELLGERLRVHRKRVADLARIDPPNEA